MIALTYTVVAVGAVPAGAVPAGTDMAALRRASAGVAAIAASLSAAHVVAAIGLTAKRPWARGFATLVCVVWALTCVGLPVALLAIASLWRSRTPTRPSSAP